VRIGVNALFLLPGRVGGTEIYLESLLAALAALDTRNEYFIYLNRETGAELVPPAPGFHPVLCHVAARFRTLRILYEQLVLPWRLARDRIDVVLNAGFTAPVMAPCPCVTVFHDLQHKRHPEFFRWFDLPFWNLFLWLAVRHSSSVIAVSEATASDLGRYYPAAERKVVVIHHGVDAAFFAIGKRRQMAREYKPHLLTVSTLHPHKNIARLLRAFQIFRQSHPRHRLIVAGLKGNAARSLQSLARELELHDAVSFTGWIPRDRLYWLFETASAFIAPSLFEGFGLPIVEALAAGLPVACSAIPVFTEVAMDAALGFDPLSVESIVAAMERIIDDSEFQARAQSAGPERARQFDWAATAERTLRELTAAACPAS
jgi:glycosyltransferase involved in cell wall biosynthesis